MNGAAWPPPDLPKKIMIRGRFLRRLHDRRGDQGLRAFRGSLTLKIGESLPFFCDFIPISIGWDFFVGLGLVHAMRRLRRSRVGVAQVGAGVEASQRGALPRLERSWAR